MSWQHWVIVTYFVLDAMAMIILIDRPIRISRTSAFVSTFIILPSMGWLLASSM